MTEANNQEITDETQDTVKFVDGGAVQADDGYYITRAADEELLELCRKGEYTHVLAPRQMGKSSLVNRTAELLYEEEINKENIKSAIVDLSPIGNEMTKEQVWYDYFFREIADQLGILLEYNKFLREHNKENPKHLLEIFFRQLVLPKVEGQIVIFLDEIDGTINLPFKDDFFATIRLFYQLRSRLHEFRRLSFVLIGVASPTDLISDPYRTPFNIGKSVSLTDFTLIEALPLIGGFDLLKENAEEVLTWIFKWTSGHPYLTQRLCILVNEENKRASWTKPEIDELIENHFFGKDSKPDKNLNFVRDMLTKRMPEGVEPAEVLLTYKDIWRKKTVNDDEFSVIKSHLKLSGVVYSAGNIFHVRNEIYRRAFDEDWIKRHLPASWASEQYQKIRRVAAVLIVLLLLLAATTAFAFYSRNLALASAKEAENAKQMEIQSAERARESAKQAREAEQTAERLKGEAEQSAKKANEANEQAQIEKQRAEAKQQEAEEQKKLAEQAKAQTEQALIVSKAAEKRAVDAEKETRTRVDLETAYRSGMSQIINENFIEAVTDLKKAQNYLPCADCAEKADLYNKIGYAYERANDKDEATNNYNDALEIYHKIKDNSGAANTFIHLASVDGSNKIAPAIDLYKKECSENGRALGNINALYKYHCANNLYKQDNNELGQGDAQFAIGKYYFDLNKFIANEALNTLTSVTPIDENGKKQSVPHYEEALKKYRSAKSISKEGMTLSTLAEIYGGEEKINYYRELAEFYKRNSNGSKTAEILESLADLYLENNQKLNARHALEQAHSIYQELSDIDNEYIILGKLTDLYKDVDEQTLNDAIANIESYRQNYLKKNEYAKVIEIWEKIGDIYFNVGKKDRAIDTYREIIEFAGDPAGDGSLEQPDFTLEGRLSRKIARIYNQQDNKTGKLQAIDYYQKARDAYLAAKQDEITEIELQEKILSTTNPKAAAIMSAMIGEIYYGLGEKQKALDNLKQSLIEANNGSIDDTVLIAVIQIQSELGEPQETDKFVENYLAKMKDNSGKESLLWSLSWHYLQLGDEQRAKKFLDRGFPLYSKTKNTSFFYSSFLNVNRLYILLKDKDKALQTADLFRKIMWNQRNKTRLYQFNILSQRYDAIGERQMASEINQFSEFGDNTLDEIFFNDTGDVGEFDEP